MEPEVQVEKINLGFDPLAAIYPYRIFLPWIVLVSAIFAFYTAVNMAFIHTLYEATTLLKLSNVTKSVSAMVSGDESGAGMSADLLLQTYVAEARSYSVASLTAETLDVSSVPYLRSMDKQPLADLLADRVTVKNYRNTNLIEISAMAESPKLAADLANTWAKCFIDENLNTEHTGAAGLHRFLEEQLAQVLERMVHGQEMLKAYNGNGGGKMMEQDLATQTSSLEQRIVQLQDEQAGLDSKYKEGHPLVKEHEAELDQAKEELKKMLEHSGDASWLNIVHEIKALEGTSDWLMEKEQETMISENNSASNILVVDPAIPPYNPAYPQRRKAVVQSGIEGALLSFGLIWLFLRIRRPVQREEDLCKATGSELLGLVPDFELEELMSPRLDTPIKWSTREGQRQALEIIRGVADDLIMRWKTALGWIPRNPAPLLFDAAPFQNTFFHKSFGEIRNRLLQNPILEKPVCISVFSPERQDGRTTINAGLALSLTHAGKKVLLVDSNFFRPAIGPLFGIDAPPKSGFATLLSSDTGAEVKPVETPYPGLHILPAPAGSALAQDWVISEPILEQIRKWKSQFDFIILDPPPLNFLSGAQNLSEIIDGIIILASSGNTGHRTLKNAMDLVQARNIPVLGCLLNRVDIRYYSLAYRQFYSYSGFGWRRDKKVSSSFSLRSSSGEGA